MANTEVVKAHTAQVEGWIKQVQQGEYPVTGPCLLDFVQDMKQLIEKVRPVLKLVRAEDSTLSPELMEFASAYKKAAKAASVYLTAVSNADLSKEMQAVAQMIDPDQPAHLQLKCAALVRDSLPFWLNKFYPDEVLTNGSKSPKPTVAFCQQRWAALGPPAQKHYMNVINGYVAKLRGSKSASVGAEIADQGEVNENPSEAEQSGSSTGGFINQLGGGLKTGWEAIVAAKKDVPGPLMSGFHEALAYVRVHTGTACRIKGRERDGKQHNVEFTIKRDWGTSAQGGRQLSYYHVTATHTDENGKIRDHALQPGNYGKNVYSLPLLQSLLRNYGVDTKPR